MNAMSSNVARGQIVLVGIIIILIGLAFVGTELFLSTRGIPTPLQGEPILDPTTGLYTVNVLVTGHRDFTILHLNLHANIHVDFVSYYFQGYQNPPSGRSWMDFSKLIHVTVSVEGSSLNSTLMNTFDASVSLGASWGQVLTYSLPSGNYNIEVQGIDQDGFASITSAQLILP
jgi:hypothetical protein